MRRLFAILLAALLLAACQTRSAGAPAPTVSPTPTVTPEPTVTPTPTLSPEEQKEQALGQALYSQLKEYGLLNRVNLQEGVVALPALGNPQVEYSIPIAELKESLKQQTSGQEMLRLGLMFGEEKIGFLRDEAQGKGYLYLKDVSFGEGLPKYTGWLEAALPTGEERNAQRPTAEEWQASFDNATPAEYERIPEDPKSQEALEFYRANFRANVEAMLALPSWQIFEMKAMLGGVKAGDLVKLQKELGVSDEQVWEIAQNLTGKTQAELSALAESPAEALEMLARLDGSLQYQRFQKDLEPQFRQVLANGGKGQKEIDGEVERIRSQLFGAFSQEELRDLAGKLGMEGAAEAEEAKIMEWLGENYHWLKTTNPFDVQILSKSYGFTSLEVDVLGFGREVRYFETEVPDGSIQKNRFFSAFVANVGPDGRSVMPVNFVFQPYFVELEDEMKNFYDEIYQGLRNRNYSISLILDFQLENYSYAGFPVAIIPTQKLIKQNGKITDALEIFELHVLHYYNKGTQVVALPDLILSGANGWEGIGDVGVIERAFGPNGYVYSGIHGNILSGYVQDYFFPLKWFQLVNRIYPLWMVSK